MKKIASLLLFLTFLVLLTSGFGSSPSSTATPIVQELGKTIIVNSTTDSGPGTLRQALLDAQSGDTITFDPTVFPPGAPATIYLTTSLPFISQGNLTVDASNAGVILDGSNIQEGGCVSGLDISSDGNTIQGLQIVSFSHGAGVSLVGQARKNTIGGDRSIGVGPIGQGNLLSNGGMGIRICDASASFNTITGNLIGTDATAENAWGNDIGIRIEDGASRNIIGPGNIIAYNSIYGVEIAAPNSFGNTIIQNSIHDNQGEGIYLYQGSNADLDAPLIFDFDLVAGTVAGIASPNCTVEIFSDGKKEGEIYEGQTTADGAGTFNFNKCAPFSGPHLTATATDPDGNTSVFSAPTSGTSRSVILQEGNNLLRTRLQHKQSKELLDNHIGDFVNFKSPDETFAMHYVNRIINFGYKWVFSTIDWFDFNEALESGEYSEFTITPEQDEVITVLVNNDIKVIYCLVYYEPVEIDVPFSWENLEAYSIKDSNKEGRFRTEGEIQRYLDYVRFIVHHFKDRIKYYQILNEPNNGLIGQYVKSEDYINLVKRVVPVIRDECLDAKIIVGSVLGLPDGPGCLPSEPGHYEYLFNILNSDIMPLVDGISFHPSGDLSPEYDGACYSGVPCDDISEGYYKYYQEILQEIKDVATSHGFRGEYISEGPTFAVQPRPPQTHYYSDIIAAKYNSRSVIMHLNENITTILPIQDLHLIPYKVAAIQNLCNIMAGTEPTSLSIEIQSGETNIRSYSFSLSNGDTLIALWTDGVAVDEDPGVKAILTFPEITAEKVMGIDILNNFEQEMITDVEDSNLVVRGLLVKDYPIILRFTNTTP